MAYKDLREYIACLESKGLLSRITEPVTWNLEITEIADRTVKANGPALLFEHVADSSMPVLINAFGSYERMNLALGVNDIEEIANRIKELLKPTLPTTMWEKLLILPKLKELSQCIPNKVKHGPCQEVVVNPPDLFKLPILYCWPRDGGRFITLPLVFTKDPESGIRNVGMYRMQVYDNQTCGMHWHIHKDGAKHYHKYSELKKRMEVAVVLGGDPATIYASTAPLPSTVDEMLFASFLRQNPVELVKCKTIDMEIPAYAEIVLEGYIEPGELQMEGPFGDHTGFYSLIEPYPVFHLTYMTHRLEPIYPTTIVGRPVMEDCYLAKATERIFLPLLKFIIPELVDMNLPLEGIFHNCCLVSIDKAYPGHALKVMQTIWGLSQLMFTKIIVIVDSDINLQNYSEVAWRVFNNIAPKNDLVVVDGPLDILDHSSNLVGYGSKMGIDATRKFESEGRIRPWPDEIKMDEEIKALVDKKWPNLDIIL